MTRYRPYLVGAVLGALALAAVPLAGLMEHGARGAPGWTGWYNWLAHRQSITLRSLTVVPPALDDPLRLARAAGHYDMVCAACHGRPGAPADRLAEDLWPRPPRLADPGTWRPDARLFQTVKHGIRHSAMPAWPVANREDEVWDMVAFLNRLPDLSPAAYAELTGGGGCRGCHGAEGEGRPGIPRLDILGPDYIAGSLRAYRDGRRASGTMIAAARGLTDAQIAALAAEFGRNRPVAPPDSARDPEAAAITAHGLVARDIPACDSCHGATRPPDHPALHGQDRDYLRRQLDLFVEEGAARGGPHADRMAKAARWLEGAEIERLADWYGR